MEKHYISECSEDMEFKTGVFNVIASGTGTGKSEFVRRKLLEMIGGDIKPEEIMYVTSRSMIRDQQSRMDGISKIDGEAMNVVRYWNSEIDALNEMTHSGIWIMNCNQLANIIDTMNPIDRERLNRVKVAVFDECHVLYCDTFMKNLTAVRCWIQDTILRGNTLFIGMTATPTIMFAREKRFGIRVRMANEKPLINYRAKHLICTNMKHVLKMFSDGRFKGKTIMMCAAVTDCVKMSIAIPNSVVLCSPSNRSYTETMEGVREYIITHNALPPRLKDAVPNLPDYLDYPIDVLITTSTMREGINLDDGNGVQNVICCLGDELHVKQFAGRCRFNVENLVVVYRFLSGDNRSCNDYLSEQRALFRDYVNDKTDRRWFDTISEIVDVPFEGVERYGLDIDVDRFCKTVEAEWMVNYPYPYNRADRIYTKEHKQWFVDLAKECFLLDFSRSKYNFLAVLHYMKNELGYQFYVGQMNNNKGKSTYRVLTGR